MSDVRYVPKMIGSEMTWTAEDFDLLGSAHLTLERDGLEDEPLGH
jgi:hypothetical protein